MGASNKVPKKPDILVAHEMCVKQRLPLVAGGLLDQPHFWLMEVEQIDQTIQRLKDQKLILE